MNTPPGGDAPERLCPRCRTPYSPDQEYCLECGLRLGAGSGLVPTLSNAWRERLGWYPGDWIWPVVLGLLIAVLAGVAAVLIPGSDNGNGALIVATHPRTVQEPVPPPATATVAVPTVPPGTPTGGGPPTTPTTPPPATTIPRPRGGLIQWPAQQNGWTVVLESIPAPAGRALSIARARSASTAGLPQVGVLDSSRFSSLHPGYFVVFSGVYASKSQADTAVGQAQAKGFRSAYSRQITR